MPQPIRTKNQAQLAATLQISKFKSETLQTMEYSLSTPSIFFYLYVPHSLISLNLLDFLGYLYTRYKLPDLMFIFPFNFFNFVSFKNY